MPKISKKLNSGFTIVEGLLILIASAIVGFTGWYVYNANNKTQDTYANADQSNSSSAIAKHIVSTDGWTPYTNKDSQYSLKYPKDWVANEYSSIVLYLAPTKKALASSNSSANGFGEIYISSAVGEHGEDKTTYINAPDFKDVQKQTVVVDGIKGTKSGGVYNSTKNAPSTVAVIGTIEVQYHFYVNNRNYELQYYQHPGWPDVLNEFNTMVTKTLKFTAN